MKLRNITFIAIAFSIAALTLNSCKPTCEKNPDDPECIQNDEEVITTVQLIVRDSISGAVVDTFQWKDADGDGVGAPVIDDINLNAYTTYLVGVKVLNELANPDDDISVEIEEEANDHQFFFHLNNSSIDIVYDDQDSNNPPKPLGLRTIWHTSGTGTDNLHVILKHQPGIKDGNEATGETDVDVEFNVVLQ